MDVSPVRLCFFRPNLPLSFKAHGGRVFVINTDVQEVDEQGFVDSVHLPDQIATQDNKENEGYEHEERVKLVHELKETGRTVSSTNDANQPTAELSMLSMEDPSEGEEFALIIPGSPERAADFVPSELENAGAATPVPDIDDGYTPSRQWQSTNSKRIVEVSPFLEEQGPGASQTMPCATPPPVPENLANPSSPIASTAVAADILAEAVPMKILVESVELFGHNTKKLVKISLQPDQPALQQLISAIRVQYGHLADMRRVLLVYFDHDVSEFVVLDEASWSEFRSQPKLLIKLAVLEFDVSNEPPAPSVQQSTSSDPELMPMPPPPPPPPPPAPNGPPPPIPMGLDDVDAKDIVLPAYLDAANNAAKSRHNYRTFHGYNEEAKALLEHITLLPPTPAGAETDIERTCQDFAWSLCSSSLPVPVHRYEVLAVNGVRLLDLDRPFQMALIKQKQRPIIVDLLPIISSTDSSDLVESTPASSMRVTYETFLAKYGAACASKLRKQVDKLLSDYAKCDWYSAKMEGTGCAHITVVSLYKYIESELVQMDLFNPKTKRGQELLGTDELLEEDFVHLKNHIETFIFNRVKDHAKSLWPIYNPHTGLVHRHKPEVSYIDLHLNIKYATPQSDLDAIQLELVPEHPINMKLAFLRFVTLEHLGLSNKPSLAAPEVTPSSASRASAASTLSKVSFLPTLIHQEEWYLIMKACHRAIKHETPQEILADFVIIMRMISHALDAYLNRPQLHDVTCFCGKVHIEGTTSKAATSVRGASQSPEGCALHSFREIEEFLVQNRDRPSVKSLFGLKFKHVEQIVECSAMSLSADELVPAFVYVLIQANPSNIEYIAYLCTEYRHPHLLKGEESYVLTQLTSAIEFIHNASYEVFDLPQSVYNHMLMRYKYTLSLLLECKNGHLNNVKYYVSKGADVNALSPDHKDNALTAAIRYNHYDILTYLLTLPMIDVNNFIHLFRGQLERGTALLLATEYNLPHVVVLLLNYHANRYLADYNQVSAFQIANMQKFYLIETILLADPMVFNLTDMVMQGNKRIVMGLVLQNVSFETVFEKYFTPLHATLLNYRIDLLKMLVSLVQKKEIDLNVRNVLGETALMLALKQAVHLLQASATFTVVDEGLFVSNVSCSPLTLLKLHRLLQAIAVLLRYGADRYLRDHHSRQSPYELAQQLDLILTSTLANYRSPSVQFLNGQRDSGLGQERPATTSSPATEMVVCDHINTELLSKVYPSGKKDLAMQLAQLAADLKALILFDPFVTMPGLHAAILPHQGRPTIDTDRAPYATPDGHSPIYELAKKGHHSAVKALVLQGMDINHRCPKTGYTALVAAVYNQDLPMCRLCVQAMYLYQFSDATLHDEYERLTGYYGAFQKLANINEVLFHAFLQRHAQSSQRPRLPQDSPFHGSAAPAIELPAPIALAVAEPISPTHLLSPGFNPVLAAATVLAAGPMAGSVGQTGPSAGVPSASACPHSLVPPAADGGQLDVNAVTFTHMTALHYAAQGGHIDVTALLLHHGASRAALNNKHHTPLDIALANQHEDVANMIKFDPEKVSICLAAKHGDVTVLRALLHQGVSINVTKKHPFNNTPHLIQHELHTPLISAVAYNQFECVKYILSVDHVQVNAQNALGYSALHYAVYCKNEGLILKLLQHGANRYLPDATSQIAIYYANVGPAFKMYVNTSSNTNPLQVPAAETSVIVNILNNDPSRVFIHDVIRKNDLQGVVALFKQGVSVNMQRGDLHLKRLNAVSSARGSRLVREAAPSLAETFVPGETPLIVAAASNRLEIAKLLCKAPDLEVDLSDVGGWTPLFHAAHQGHEDMVLLLLKAKASRNHRDKNGKRAMDVAATSNNLQIAAIVEADPYCVHIHDMCEQGKLLHVIALLKQGCPPNYRDERMGMQMQTPLMAAASTGRADIVRMLIRLPDVLAGVDGLDDLGRTALMRAAAIGALDVTAVLLNAGCDRNLKDRQGLTAYDHASRHSYGVMFKYSAQTMIR